MKSNTNSTWLGFLCLSMVFALQSCSSKATSDGTGKLPFQFAILDRDITLYTSKLGQTWETAWPLLQQSYPSNVEYVFTEKDVDTYEWSDQILTFTSQASKKFLKNANIVLNGQDIDYLHGRAFIVVYEGVPVYGGVFLADIPTATAYEYPVIYPDISDGKISFVIRPYRSVFEIDATDPKWGKIRDQRIEKIFDQLDKLDK